MGHKEEINNLKTLNDLYQWTQILCDISEFIQEPVSSFPVLQLILGMVLMQFSFTSIVDFQ